MSRNCKRIKKKHLGNYAYMLEFTSSEYDETMCSIYSTPDALYEDLSRIMSMHENEGCYIIPYNGSMDEEAERHGGNWPAGRYGITRIKIDESMDVNPIFKSHLKYITGREREIDSSACEYVDEIEF